jgi:hypothetical protein
MSQNFRTNWLVAVSRAYLIAVCLSGCSPKRDRMDDTDAPSPPRPLTRGVLLEAIEDAVHGQRSPEHLVEWHRIISRQNPAKNAITRYGRLFSFQHYWRLLHTRHPAAVKRNIARLRAVFAEFFDVGDDSIYRDLKFISRRLGRGWERRMSPLA